ncbi:hypothetical protein GJ496_006686 [Pomphorhynchus laevis]|nr:hypothetical protein GJ496_006686 [Pomphorhynchus laevis]
MQFDELVFCKVNSRLNNQIRIRFTSETLDTNTAKLAEGFAAICIFVHDNASAEVLNILASFGVTTIAMRCTNSNNIDLEAAKILNIKVLNVPVYSPRAIAEYAVGLMLTVVRKIPQSYNRVRQHNFSIEPFVGFDLYGKTVGLIGVGVIGRCVISILNGFGCKVIAFDADYNTETEKELNFAYCGLDELICESKVIFLFIPLIQQSHHIINSKSISTMQEKVVIINVSRGGLIDAEALVEGLVSGKIFGAGLDVFENGIEYAYKSWIGKRITDKHLMRLVRMPHVVLTSYQSFLTEQSLSNIADVTITNIIAAMENHPNLNNVYQADKEAL